MAKAKTKKLGRPFNHLFRAEYYVRIYQLARDGLSDIHIAKAMGVSPFILKRWCKGHPAVRQAIAEGRGGSSRKDNETLQGYIYKQLPKRLKALWDEVNQVNKLPDAVERLDAMFQRNGERARQQLFLHACIVSNFSIARACRRVGITDDVYKCWKYNDPRFGELVKAIEEQRKNFFEDSLTKLVRQGDSAATIFVNKTANREKYGDKIVVEGNIKHSHEILDVSELGAIPLELRQKMLERARERIIDAPALPAKEESDE